MKELKEKIEKVIDDYETTNIFRIAEVELLLKKNKNLINSIEFDDGEDYITELYNKMITELETILGI